MFFNVLLANLRGVGGYLFGMYPVCANEGF